MKECCCEWCKRTEENYNGRFYKINNKIYCSKHYQQVRNGSLLINNNRVVREHGINDTSRGWLTENNYNKKIYELWCTRLRFVYDEKFHNKQPTYINSTLCLEWHWLSKFAEDIIYIDGFDYEKFMNGELELDKDIKSNGQNKEYSLENCMFVSKLENIKQANKTKDISYMKGEKHWNFGNNFTKETIHKMSISHKGLNNYGCKKVAQYNKNGELIKVWDYIKQASDELKIDSSAISKCCRGKLKTTGGYIWKYV